MISPKFFFVWMSLLPLLCGSVQAQYVGSERCAGCHEDAYQRWQQSHHWQAMQPANEETVLGDFNNTSFTHFGVTSTFYQKDGSYFVRTDNAQGEMQEFPISYTFGFSPLQQYLIGFDDGRYQALSIAWDSRPASEGGQRWFHLYPDEPMPHDDPLHWTGAFQNWNTRCASCHSTNLEKNYTQQSDSFATSWSDITVGCEACHGEGTAHLQWAANEHSSTNPTNPTPGNPDLAEQEITNQEIPNKGLTTALSTIGHWQEGEGPTRQLADGHGQQQQLAACGGCHSRRQELGHAVPGTAFLDQYTPSLLLDGLYYPDGQIEDEVYVYGSFAQSKMHAAGVVCSNCHEPHSLKLRAQGNALCSQCHDPATFDDASHHHHPQQSAGAQCINCHMPSRDYMVVDPRHDHSFRIPQPALGDLFGTPNACTGCHQDRDNAWAKQALKQWLGHQPLRDDHTATLAIARNNRPAALQPLLKLARDESKSTILRATAVQESGRFPATESITNAIEQLYADEGLMRLAAVRALEAMPPQQRYTLLEPLLDDPLKAVRMEMASSLSDVDVKTLTPAQQKKLTDLFDEYLTTQRYNADMPSVQLNMGIFYTGRGETQLALQAYEHALRLSPGYLPAMLNLADLYRNEQQDDKAKPLLLQAIATAPEQAPPHHALGLLLVRQQQLAQALPHLQQAAELAPESARYSYVYGVALHSGGRVDEAIAVLTEAARQHPQNREIRGALEAYQGQTSGQ
jgi:predicted CXXCH cytochrome family protein